MATTTNGAASAATHRLVTGRGSVGTTTRATTAMSMIAAGRSSKQTASGTVTRASDAEPGAWVEPGDRFDQSERDEGDLDPAGADHADQEPCRRRERGDQPGTAPVARRSSRVRSRGSPAHSKTVAIR